MSRIGKQPIPVPNGVEVTIASGTVQVKGPKGMLSRQLHPHITAELVAGDEGKEVRVAVADPELVKDRALWGLFRALIAGMVEGVTKGFEKKLEVVGVGYKVAGGGSKVTLEVGYSHPVEVVLPAGVTATVEKNTITLQAADKELLGETAASMRRVRKPEPYKGKGIRYADEQVRRKAGKAAKSAK